MKNTPNHRGDPLKNSKNILFQKSKCTHVSSINLNGKVSDSKNLVTALVYFCSYPCGTPCMYLSFELESCMEFSIVYVRNMFKDVCRIKLYSCSNIFVWTVAIMILQKYSAFHSWIARRLMRNWKVKTIKTETQL